MQDQREHASCPTCDRGFDSEKGMKIHHSRTHGESLAGFGKECSYCGDAFRAMMSEREYCSQSCAAKDKFQGEDNPAWNGGKDVLKCERCGERYEVTPAVAEQRRFCSIKCRGEAHSENISGSGNPNYKGATTECEYCGDVFSIQPHKLENPYNNYCSTGCWKNNLSETHSGETHPCWKGGHNPDYGDNWHEQREKCIERDSNQCRGCGITRQQHINTFNGDLHAHHIIPKRKFESLEAANDLGNLVTLCMQCHPKWEGVPVAPQ